MSLSGEDHQRHPQLHPQAHPQVPPRVFRPHEEGRVHHKQQNRHEDLFPHPRRWLRQCSRTHPQARNHRRSPVRPGIHLRGCDKSDPLNDMRPTHHDWHPCQAQGMIHAQDDNGYQEGSSVYRRGFLLSGIRRPEPLHSPEEAEVHRSAPERPVNPTAILQRLVRHRG